MMLPLLSFFLTACVLTSEGYLVVISVTRTRGEKVLAWALGYPIGALLNALLFFLLNAFTIPLRFFSVSVAHLILLTVLVSVARYVRGTSPLNLREATYCQGAIPRKFTYLLLILLGCTLLSGVVIAVTIPSFYRDIFSNWAMQAKQFFLAGQLLTEGVAKPHYPILMHALQMVFMFSGGWNDHVANSATLLLSLTSFLSLYLLLQRSYGEACARITLTFLITLPLATIHLRQGYADIHTATYLLLSAILLERALRKNDGALLQLSALLTAAAAWTKLEGLYLGCIPWLFFVLLEGSRMKRMKSFLPACITILCLILPWPLYLLFQDLPLTPNDSLLEWHLQEYPMILRKLFVFESFGVYWYIILGAFFVLLFSGSYKWMPTWRMLLWGVNTSLLLIFFFLFTDDVEWLRQRTAFTRAMLFPTMLLIQAFVIHYVHHYMDGLSSEAHLRQGFGGQPTLRVGWLPGSGSNRRPMR